MSNVNKRPNGRWRARFRDESGREHSRDFVRKVDAQRWIDETTASIVTGQYVDPNAGKVGLREYAEKWRANQVHRPTSRAHVETNLRRQVYPYFGDRPIASIRPGEIQAWVRMLGDGDASLGRRPLAPSTVGVIHGVLSGVFKSAVRDRLIVANPCEGTRLPRVERPRIIPPTAAQVAALRDAMPSELKAVVVLAAGTGMRQGELLGLTIDRIDFERHEVHVDRQLVTLTWTKSQFGPPKTPRSNRTIPLPQVVEDALREHLHQHPPGPDGLVFTLDGKPITRQSFGHVWRPAARSVGWPVGKGVHFLRHYYASLLIRYGESVKTVQDRLGHATAAETLDTYSHLWPDSADRTREAIDAAFAATKPETKLERSTRLARAGPKPELGGQPYSTRAAF